MREASSRVIVRELLERADRALYKAKGQGKRRVEADQ